MAESNTVKRRAERIAIRRIEGFSQQYDSTYVKLACHAAFPLALTPDLLYQIWANFVPDAPWTAVARLLLSRLCKEVDYEIYEMETAVRNLLLRQLKKDFGAAYFEEVGDFLLSYMHAEMDTDDADTQDLIEAQEWSVLSYAVPRQGARKLAEELSESVAQDDPSAILRITTLLYSLKDPLIEAGFESLLLYSEGIESFARGDVDQAIVLLDTMLSRSTPSVIEGISLPVPQLVQQVYEERTSLKQDDDERTSSRGDKDESEFDPTQTTCFLIAVGGTGAKCVESVIQLAAAGLFPVRSLQVLFVDPDETNGNLDRARVALNRYQKCRSLFSQEDSMTSWMQTDITSLGLWSPFFRGMQQKSLGDLFEYTTLSQSHPEMQNLFDVLYTKRERETDLGAGFRGHASLAAAVMSHSDLDQMNDAPWRTLLHRIKTEVGSGCPPRIILCGSTFGGTGSAGLAVVGRKLSNKLRDENIERILPPVACVAMLPYFGFSPSPGIDNELHAHSDAFLLKTAATLREIKKVFKFTYLVGNQRLTRVPFSIGMQTQRNQSHFAELYAALAIRNHTVKPLLQDSAVMVASRQSQGSLTWADLPDYTSVKPALANTTRFTYVWLANIAPELRRAQRVGVARFQVEAPWFTRFFQGIPGTLGKIFGRADVELAEFNIKEQDDMTTISSWCQDYVRWITEIHSSDGENINLFNVRLLQNLTGEDTKLDELSMLVLPATSSNQDSIPNLKTQLDNPQVLAYNGGSVRLAQALFSLCSL